jgi:hypothetical protein
VINRIGCDDDVFPDLVQQLLDADDLSRVFGKTDQEAHRPGLEFDGGSVLRDLVKRRVDAPSADLEYEAVWRFHRRRPAIRA